MNELYDDWEIVTCDCCGGLQWGGEEPTECRECGGMGTYARHKKSGALAQYPGGPFIGRESKTDMHKEALDKLSMEARCL